jgi:hypothetical protein
MTIEQAFCCDGPDCVRRVSGAAHREPGGRFLTVTGWGKAMHFCGWDCVLRYAGRIEPETIIPAGGPDD